MMKKLLMLLCLVGCASPEPKQDPVEEQPTQVVYYEGIPVLGNKQRNTICAIARVKLGVSAADLEATVSQLPFEAIVKEEIIPAGKNYGATFTIECPQNHYPELKKVPVFEIVTLNVLLGAD